MRRTSSAFAACFMVAVWLLATHHAVFEAAGWMPVGFTGPVAASTGDNQQGWHHAEKTVTKKEPERLNGAAADGEVSSASTSILVLLLATLGLRRPNAAAWYRVRHPACLPRWDVRLRLVPAGQAP